MTVETLEPALLASPEFHAAGDRHRLWRRMRRDMPVYWHPPAELPGFWSVTRYDDVRAVYGDPAKFSSADGVLLRPASLGNDPGGGRTLALTDPPRHRKLRSLIAARFNARAVRSMQGVLRAQARAAVTAAIERGSCDFAQDVAARLSISTICRIMGMPEGDFESVYRWTHEAFKAQKSLTTYLPIMNYFIDLMCQRKGVAPTDDVAGLLAHGAVDGTPLTEEEILLNFENLVGATENAGLSMATGMLALLEHPDQWQRLREDRRLIPSAIEELLRWASSATHSMRTTTGPHVLGGQSIAAGDRVVLWLPSANRDESAFPDPDRFDLGRQRNRHVALGAGEHACIGGSLARLQLGALLPELLDTAREIELAGPVIPVRSIAVSGPAQLPVRIMAR
ncbi:MAG: cytochrome P450 [Streptosporangiaceae bacterium]|nr:cytochrome P450 [Streptosporangiaceae bacterium]